MKFAEMLTTLTSDSSYTACRVQLETDDLCVKNVAALSELSPNDEDICVVVEDGSVYEYQTNKWVKINTYTDRSVKNWRQVLLTANLMLLNIAGETSVYNAPQLDLLAEDWVVLDDDGVMVTSEGEL